MNAYETVLEYHRETKHHFYRLARSLGYMDWKNQPDPFRRYKNTPVMSLPLSEGDESPPYADLYRPDQLPVRPFSPRTISQFLEHSLAISAWKAFRGNRWALRVNPSSGNLHPTEGYLILGPEADLHSQPAIYHYNVHQHALERRTEFSTETWETLLADFPRPAFLVGLSSIHWREAWKYGERAFRYCQHDIGHALAALRLAAAGLGWQLTLLAGLGDFQIGSILGLARPEDFIRAEPEHPDLLALVYSTGGPEEIPQNIPFKAIAPLTSGRWAGRANRLSPEHVEWEIIDRAAQATIKPITEPSAPGPAEMPPPLDPTLYDDAPTARRIIRQRRSAVALDSRASLAAEPFYRMLGRTLPGGVPWDAVPWQPRIHLGLFVHRVKPLPRGLYLLVRNPAHTDRLRQLLKPEFEWDRPHGCPDWLPLYLLHRGDYRDVAAEVSCNQDIAGDGAFSLAMLAQFRQPLQEIGPWYYRRLFWEAGMIGQLFYLEAEALGARATGIGCYFDDPVHSIFGLPDEQFQSLYHLTVGSPVEDHRLTTLPAYAHLEG